MSLGCVIRGAAVATGFFVGSQSVVATFGATGYADGSFVAGTDAVLGVWLGYVVSSSSGPTGCDDPLDVSSVESEATKRWRCPLARRSYRWSWSAGLGRLVNRIGVADAQEVEVVPCLDGSVGEVGHDRSPHGQLGDGRV